MVLSPSPQTSSLPGAKKLMKRAAPTGETVREYIARQQPASNVEFYAGRLFVSDTQIAKDTGLPWREVTLAFKDEQGESCRYKRLFYQGQTAYADIFLPYHKKEVVVGVSGVKTEKVEVDPKRGGGSIYIYEVKVLFVFSLHTFRPGQEAPIETPEPEPIGEVPGGGEPEPSWDAALPDEILPEPEAEKEPEPTPIMTPEQLMKERQTYWSMLEETMPKTAEREAFLDLHGLARVFLEWTMDQLKTFDDQLECWYDAITPEHPLGHDNWDQPALSAQRDAILAIAKRFPDEKDGKRFITDRLIAKGRIYLKDMTRAGIECFRRELLADPACPPESSTI